MILYLVQHADAMRDQENPSRPLSGKGWSDINKMADYAQAHLDIEVPRILHSGKTRARQTAEMLAKGVSPTPRVEEVDSLDPNQDPQLWARRLTQMAEDVMLVGHLPHVGKLASLLLCEDSGQSVVSFQAGGILSLEKGEGGTWSVQWMLVPAIL